jgi:pyruvate dehydrogenase E1 component alpha subunit
MKNKLIYLRKSQLVLNDLIKENKFKFPIHLALGAEANSLITSILKKESDYLILNHRNIHHNLLYTNFEDILTKFYDQNNAINFGSMNLCSFENKLVYTSSILANSTSIATGIAIESKLKGRGSKAMISIGDGAIEEGAFYESISISSFMKLPITYLVEDNGMSMSSPIESRRINFDLSKLAAVFSIQYLKIDNSDSLSNIIDRLKNLNYSLPCLIHFKYKLYCNHAGKTPGWDSDPKNLKINSDLIFEDYSNDPLYYLFI